MAYPPTVSGTGSGDGLWPTIPPTAERNIGEGEPHVWPCWTTNAARCRSVFFKGQKHHSTIPMRPRAHGRHAVRRDTGRVCPLAGSTSLCLCLVCSFLVQQCLTHQARMDDMCRADASRAHPVPPLSQKIRGRRCAACAVETTPSRHSAPPRPFASKSPLEKCHSRLAALGSPRFLRYGASRKSLQSVQVEIRLTRGQEDTLLSHRTNPT